ncbi:hypothetical protein COLAER_01363 [Collinsella aerofaciens ATCC 25986]|uniref:Uncharacterized protein n=1 Tax=Collinsella aerofaciens (strain ATCC 25986 / DSM 3979 / JCM 10188 / KCTC 3647 / NCTC 11838 / VPI 1003) TaxID=411903 RepID=A4EAA7_COLAA|nr:hypothetical protein COLAER_01363 [Collinsella aerofaciens ATCC 25986]
MTTGLRLIAAVNAATTEITPYAMTSNGILHNTASPTMDVVEAPARMRATGYSDPPAPFLITDTTTAGTIDTKSSTKPSRRASATAVRKRTCAVAGIWRTRRERHCRWVHASDVTTTGNSKKKEGSAAWRYERRINGGIFVLNS